MEKEIERLKKKWRDGKRDGVMEKEIERWKKRWRDGKRDREMEKEMERWKKRWRDGKRDGEMEKEMERWKKRWRDGKRDGEMEKEMDSGSNPALLHSLPSCRKPLFKSLILKERRRLTSLIQCLTMDSSTPERKGLLSM
ncbi:hypothetical protein BgiBS90_031188 [Biomphalaria glabrata]|nr:hypothetical protein BgiBS90_031188 [Biomphalaria glabrata]